MLMNIFPLHVAPQWPAKSRMVLLVSLLVVSELAGSMHAQTSAQTLAPGAETDSDHDGLSDSLEQALLVQFEPVFMVGRHDCSDKPAEFHADSRTPKVVASNGTIYGQVFPTQTSNPAGPFAELHYYHLWRIDCGPHGHALDTEHVAALVQASDAHLSSATWKAAYWYAAAHEDTVCDVSQIARASTLQAVTHGPTIWISPG